MNNEQIKEVMRLSDDIRTAHTSEWDVSDLVEAQNDLEAYLRTIGEPENTFPLNPNGSSKWAHLQKHDGAQAIGVVFRTGTGSVGSLVDGRVVWADWLAYPNGSKSADSEYTDEDMAAVGRALMSAITQYAPKGWSPADCPSEIVGDLHNECEELRSDAERYRKLRDVDAWGEDTAPDGGSAWARLGELHGSEFDAFVDSRAESAIESPAKVSPCAGHAVQQEAGHGLRDKRADMQPRKPGVEMAIDDEVLEALGKRERMMTYVVANCMRMYHKKHNGTLETSSVLRSLKRMEKAGKVRRVKSVYARQICWQAVKQPPKGGNQNDSND